MPETDSPSQANATSQRHTITGHAIGSQRIDQQLVVDILFKDETVAAHTHNQPGVHNALSLHRANGYPCRERLIVTRCQDAVTIDRFACVAAQGVF